MNFIKEKSNIILVVGFIIIMFLVFWINFLANDSKKENSNLLSGKHYVEMKIVDYGTIKLELDADIAPITVTNFINLVNDGFYNGLTFHRIIDGFMVQGGDPLGTGMGGSSETIKGEFSLNGVENNLSQLDIKHDEMVSNQFHQTLASNKDKYK